MAARARKFSNISRVVIKLVTISPVSYQIERQMRDTNDAHLTLVALDPQLSTCQIEQQCRLRKKKLS